MFPMTFDQCVTKAQDFNKSFIDLKVVGYNSFADAFNALTTNFFASQVNQSKTVVEQVATQMKKACGGK